MPDYGILQMPNFASAALSGYQAGQSIGRQRRLDSALGAVDLSRPETIMPVLQADPRTGGALLSAASKMAEAQHETAGRVALSNYLTARMSKGGGQAISASGATAPASSPAGMPQDIVVTAPSQQADPEHALIQADPKAWLEVQGNLGKLDENKRKAVADAADAQATVATAAAQMPYEQRKAYIQSQMSYLTAHGVSPEEVNAFDPTDANVQAQANQALGVKGILERQDKDRSYNLQERKFQHDVSQDAATLGVSQGNLAVSQGQLALARQREGRVAAAAREKAAAGTAATIPAPTSRAAYNALAKGTRYRAPDGSLRIK